MAIEKLVKVKANHTVVHDGHNIAPGSVFKIDEKNAADLLKLGAVTVVVDGPAAAAPTAAELKVAADKKAAEEKEAADEAEKAAAEAAAKVAPGAK